MLERILNSFKAESNNYFVGQSDMSSFWSVLPAYISFRIHKDNYKNSVAQKLLDGLEGLLGVELYPKLAKVPVKRN